MMTSSQVSSPQTDGYEKNENSANLSLPLTGIDIERKCERTKKKTMNRFIDKDMSLSLCLSSLLFSPLFLLIDFLCDTNTIAVDLFILEAGQLSRFLRFENAHNNCWFNATMQM